MPSISQKQAAHLDALDNIGVSDNSQAGEFTDELSLIETIAGQFIERVKNNIEAANMVVTGRIDDLSIERTETGFNILGNAYLLYLDQGVNGVNVDYGSPYSFRDKMPPVSEIKKWVIARGLATDDKVESTAYAIAKSIQMKGIKPRNVLSKEVNQLADDLAKSYADLTVNLILK